MTGPRSARLLSWKAAASGASPVYVSPANMTTIVKFVAWTNSGAASLSFSVNMQTASAAVNVPLVLATIAVSASGQWQGAVVLNPGDAMYVFSGAAGLGVWISGSVMQGLPPVAPAESSLPIVQVEDLPLAEIPVAVAP